MVVRNIGMDVTRNKLMAELLKRGVGSLKGRPLEKCVTLELWAAVHGREKDLGDFKEEDEAPSGLCVL